MIEQPNSKTLAAEHGIKFGTDAAYLRLDRLDDLCVSHPNRPYMLDEAGSWSKADITAEVYDHSVIVKWQRPSGGPLARCWRF